ncbi:putative O-methyltransferase YrrM [Pedobacter sp. CAN_A7]|uniref:O-methyltransferase n=1 Tax=Pedobacter sp. CAN_A7 TaxID=2787722 RepID=UPI0018CB7E25
MTDEIVKDYPINYLAIDEATKQSGFEMASDPKTCSLLKTLAASKPNGNLLELGTGTGLSTSWILEGMDTKASLTSIDNDIFFLDIAKKDLKDSRLKLVNQDAGEWIKNNKALKFDFIFADTWYGKYLMLEEILEMLSPGGLYILDDMLPQSNWPEGHQEKALKLLHTLSERPDLKLTRQCWATGIIIASKK